MALDLTVRHGVIVDEVARRMIETKVEKLSRFSRHIVAEHVIVERDGSGLLLELNLTVSKRIFTAKANAFDLADAIEGAIDKMARQLRRYEERSRSRKKEAGIGRQDG